MKWYQDAQGNTSSMRIMAMLSTCTGVFCVLAGVVAVYLRYPEGVHLVTVGAGMTGLGEVAKAWQAQKGS